MSCLDIKTGILIRFQAMAKTQAKNLSIESPPWLPMFGAEASDTTVCGLNKWDSVEE